MLFFGLPTQKLFNLLKSFVTVLIRPHKFQFHRQKYDQKQLVTNSMNKIKQFLNSTKKVITARYYFDFFVIADRKWRNSSIRCFVFVLDHQSTIFFLTLWLIIIGGLLKIRFPRRIRSKNRSLLTVNDDFIDPRFNDEKTIFKKSP